MKALSAITEQRTMKPWCLECDLCGGLLGGDVPLMMEEQEIEATAIQQGWEVQEHDDDCPCCESDSRQWYVICEACEADPEKMSLGSLIQMNRMQMEGSW